MPGYLDTAQSFASGYKLFSTLGTGTVSNMTEINFAIDAMKTWLTAHSWTNPGGDGTYSVTVIQATAIPFHAGASGGFSQVPSNAKFFGKFGLTTPGNWYELWDPNSNMGGPFGTGDVDPTAVSGGPDGGPIVGVELGLSAQDTLNNFINKVETNMPDFGWTFGTLDMTGSGTGSVQAVSVGPQYNDPLVWEPAASNIFGPVPSGGGWKMVSAMAPTTNDQMHVLIYKPSAQEASPDDILMSFKATIGGVDCDPIRVASGVTYFATNCPYQLMMQMENGQSPEGHGDTNFLASCLNVPDDVAPVDFTISTFLTGSGATTVQTSAPHGILAGAMVWIRNVTGVAAAANGRYYVDSVPALNQLILKTDDLGMPVYFSGGGGWSVPDGGVVTTGVFNAIVVTTLSNGNFWNRPVGISVNGQFKSSWTADGDRNLNAQPLHFPLVNAGLFNQNAPTNTSVAKPLMHAPYVSLMIMDNHEGRVTGLLWDSLVELRLEAVQNHAQFEGTTTPMVNVIAEQGTIKNVAASLWFIAKET